MRRGSWSRDQLGQQSEIDRRLPGRPSAKARSGSGIVLADVQRADGRRGPQDRERVVGESRQDLRRNDQKLRVHLFAAAAAILGARQDRARHAVHAALQAKKIDAGPLASGRSSSESCEGPHRASSRASASDSPGLRRTS